MRKKLKVFFLTILIILFASLLSFYVFVSVYYRDGFTYGTWVNGVYCTGKSVEEVNDLLKASFVDTKLVISSDFSEDEAVLLTDIDFTVDYSNELYRLYSEQNPWRWVENLFLSTYYGDFEKAVSYNEAKLKEKLLALDIVNEYSASRPQTVEIRYDRDAGYYLYEDINKELNYDKFYDLVCDALLSSLSVDVPADYFLERPLTAEMERTYGIWREVSGFLEPKLIYDMGAELVEIDSSILSGFISYNLVKQDFERNEDSSIHVSEEKMLSYIDDLCESYNTYKKPRDYVTYKGETKHINLSTYGTLLNKKAEEQYFCKAVMTGLTEVHMPTYIYSGYVRGLNDIGSTFIEVDLTNQILLCVVNGDVALECDIVSGKPTGGNATPEIVCSVLKKQRNRYLRGADYVSFVKYWIPFYGGDGFHDASWQRAFGGERYIRYGSHGCINMREQDVKELFDLVEVGTPVIVYK